MAAIWELPRWQARVIVVSRAGYPRNAGFPGHISAGSQGRWVSFGAFPAGRRCLWLLFLDPEIGMETAQAASAPARTAAGFVLGIFTAVSAVHGSLLCPKKRPEGDAGHGGAGSPGRWFCLGLFLAGRRCSWQPVVPEEVCMEAAQEM